LPNTLEAVLGKALAKNPGDRYETAGRLLAHFKAALSAPTIQPYESKTYSPPNPSFAPTILVSNPPKEHREQNSVFVPMAGIPMAQPAFMTSAYVQPSPSIQQIETISRRPALRQGLIFGVFLGIIEILFSYISQAVPLGSISTLIAYLLYLVFGLIAGMRASQQTGTIRTGLVAGLWTGLFSSLISSIVSFIITIANLDTIIANLQDTARRANQDPNIYTTQTVLKIELFFLAIIIVIAILLGLVGGAIGGVLGKNRANIPVQEY
jgi:hypothetical protein